MIFIYRDKGVSEVSAAGFMTYFGLEKAKYVTGAFLQNPDWIKTTDLLIMPGGRSLPYYESLAQQGNKNIIDFVTKGGVYLGICAGAYYAARKTIFAEDRPEHYLLLPGALNFFEGEAIGPVFSEDKFAYASEAGAKIVDIDFQGDIYPSYFNGGCTFSDNAAVIARFMENGLPAILSFPYHQGRVVLSGIHPELDYRTIPAKQDLHHQELRDALRKKDSKRRELLVKLIKECYASSVS